MSVVVPAEQKTITRRSFYVAALYGIWTIIGGALGLPALLYLLLPPRLKRMQEWTPVGDIGGLAPDQPVEMAFRQNRADGWKINSEKLTAWVVKRPDRSVLAFGPQCTHLGCAYRWEEGRNEFVCPCHNSIFSVDGKVLSGPAPRPLDRYDIRVEGNKLLVGALLTSAETTSGREHQIEQRA
jgi:menaquinol-cytochrome c reductase iron-sulfur subunit